MRAITNISIFPITNRVLFSSYNLNAVLDWPYSIFRNGLQLCCQQLNKKSFVKNKNSQEKSDWENDQLYGPVIKLIPSRKTVNKSSKKSKLKDSKEVCETRRAIKSSSELKIKQKNNLTPKQNNSKTSSQTENDTKLEVVCEKSNGLKTLPGSKTIDFPLILDTCEKSLEENNVKEHLATLAKNVLSIPISITEYNNYKPSITSILQQTMPAESAAILEHWRLQMIESLGVEGFAKYKQDTFQRGASLHEAIRKYLSGTEHKSFVTPMIYGYWQSISTVLQDITDVVCLEEKISHSYLSYCGITDCVAKYRDQNMLIEWKTSQKPKPTLKHTYDNTLQVVAYIGAYNSLPEHVTKQLDNGLIVIAYEDGSPAHAHKMSRSICEDTWKLWLRRLQEFWQFKTCLINKQK